MLKNQHLLTTLLSHQKIEYFQNNQIKPWFNGLESIFWVERI